MSESEPAADADGGEKSEVYEDVPIASRQIPSYFPPSSSSSSDSDAAQDDNDDDEKDFSDAPQSNLQALETSKSEINQTQDVCRSNLGDYEGEWTYEMEEMKNGSHCQEKQGHYKWDGDGGDTSQDDSRSQSQDDTSSSSGDKIQSFKIFVSNLPPGIEKSVLQELFEKYGDVLECENFAKNYAFVHMASEECGKRALEELNGYEIQGCKLNVKRSHHTGKGLSTESDGSYIKTSDEDLICGTFKLYIAHLPDDVTKDYVTKLLEDYGRIVEMEIYRGNSAFVHMETEEAAANAIKALNGKNLPDVPDTEKPLTVAASVKEGTPSLPITKLKVSNVSLFVSANDLRKLFMPYGLVTKVKIFKRKFYKATGRNAVVYLEQYGNIRSAIKELNGIDVQGQNIQVEGFFGNEEDLAPPPPKPKHSPANNFFGNQPPFENMGFPAQLPRRPPMPFNSTRRLIPMPSQNDFWYPPPPVQHPTGMRIIPMPSRKDLQRGSHRGRPAPPPPLMGQRLFGGQYNDDNLYDDVINDGFGGGYSDFNEDNFAQHDDNSFCPPPRKISKKNKRNQKASDTTGRQQFPELPSSEDFPKVPPSIMSLKITDPSSSTTKDIDYSADLPLSDFSDFSSSNTVQQDFSCDNYMTSSLNAVPFDYSQMGNKKRNFNSSNNSSMLNFNKMRNMNSFGNGRSGQKFRGNRGGKKAKGKSRRPGLGTSEQLKKFANQTGLDNNTQVAQVQETPAEQESSKVATSESDSPYAPYYFQQNWNFKNKNRKPSAKEVKDADEEQKRLYAEYLKQKPWLYQPIPGTVKKVQK